MAVSLSQMWTVAKHVRGRKLWPGQRYPTVLMLEPIFRGDLACAGCSTIQYPGPRPSDGAGINKAHYARRMP